MTFYMDLFSLMHSLSCMSKTLTYSLFSMKLWSGEKDEAWIHPKDHRCYPRRVTFESEFQRNSCVWSSDSRSSEWGSIKHTASRKHGIYVCVCVCVWSYLLNLVTNVDVITSLIFLVSIRACMRVCVLQPNLLFSYGVFRFIWFLHGHIDRR